MNNILEEYLVKIGALADARSFQNAQNLVNGLSGSLQTLGKVLRFGGIVGMFAGLVKGIADQIKSVATLDMQYQKLAKDMWTTKETAKQLTVIKDVMKATENDIAFIPELREQFVRLRAEMQALATPPDAADQLKWVRSIGYEVESLQVKLQMFREWLVYYLIKYLGPYIKQFKEFLQWLNSQFADKIAIWANKLAYILARIVGLIVSAGRAVKWFVGGLWDFFDSLPEKTKKMVTLFAAAGAAIMMSPFGMLLVAIGGAMLLLEDFFYFLDGKKSSRTLAPMWAAIIKFANGTGATILDTIKTALNNIVDILSKAIKELKITEVVSSVAESIGEIAGGLFEVAKGIGAVLKAMGIGKPQAESFFGGLAYHVSKTIQDISRLGGAIGKIFKAVGLALQGNWSGAWKALKEGIASGNEAATDLANRTSLKGVWDDLMRNGTSRNGTPADHADFHPNEVARQAAKAAKWVEQQTGVSADLIYAQWAHESENFSSPLARENLNFGGLTQSEWNGDDNKQPDGSNYYKVYNSIEEYARDYVKSFLALYKRVDGHAITTPEEFVDILRDEKYFTADPGKYLAAVKAHMGKLGAVEKNNSNSGNEKTLSERLKALGEFNFSPNSYAASGAGAYAMPGVGTMISGSNNSNVNVGSIIIYSNDPKTAGKSVTDALKARQGDAGVIG